MRENVTFLEAPAVFGRIIIIAYKHISQEVLISTPDKGSLKTGCLGDRICIQPPPTSLYPDFFVLLVLSYLSQIDVGNLSIMQ